MSHKPNAPILPHKLTQIQHEVLIGTLLGDGSLGRQKKKGKEYGNPRLTIARQILDIDYLKWQFNIFKDFFSSENSFKEFPKYDERYDTNYKYCSFRTRAVPAFLDYYNEWYPNKIKIIPKDLQLTPMICAIWFADDGTATNINNSMLRIKLCTNLFSKSDVERLANQLSDLCGGKFTVQRVTKNKNQWTIGAATAGSAGFFKYINSEFSKISMDRKRDKWKNLDLDKLNLNKPHSSHLDLFREFMIENDSFSMIDLCKAIDFYNFDKNKFTYPLAKVKCIYLNKLIKHNFLYRNEDNYSINQSTKEELFKLIEKPLKDW